MEEGAYRRCKLCVLCGSLRQDNVYICTSMHSRKWKTKEKWVSCSRKQHRVLSIFDLLCNHWSEDFKADVLTSRKLHQYKSVFGSDFQYINSRRTGRSLKHMPLPSCLQWPFEKSFSYFSDKERPWISLLRAMVASGCHGNIILALDTIKTTEIQLSYEVNFIYMCGEPVTFCKLKRNLN